MPSQLDEYTIKSLFAAIMNYDFRAVERLVSENNCLINAKNDKGSTALLIAADKGPIHIMNYLLDMGADINAQNNSGRTALMCAAFNGKKICLESLLKHGADINLQNDIGETALFHAALMDKTDCVKLLLEAGINTHITNKDNQKAVEYARNLGGHEIRTLLEGNYQQSFLEQRSLDCTIKNDLEPNTLGF